LDEPTITLGIAGLGTVGAGVVKIIQSKSEMLRMRTGRDIEIVAVSARSAGKDRGAICLPIAGMMIP
jgi:homoserine dehydrogenase